MAYGLYYTFGRIFRCFKKPKPIDWIETWDDLYELKDIRIQTCDLCDLGNYIKNFGIEPMAQEFLTSTDFINENETMIGQMDIFKSWDFDGMRTGRIAIVEQTHILQIYMKQFISNSFKKDQDFHLSKGEPKPFFMSINSYKLNHSLADKLNLV